jgi:hypothetical protein
MRKINCRERKIQLYAVFLTGCNNVRKTELLFKMLKGIELWYLYLYHQPEIHIITTVGRKLTNTRSYTTKTQKEDNQKEFLHQKRETKH